MIGDKPLTHSFESLLCRKLIVGDFEYNKGVQDKLLSIFSTDVTEGTYCWKLLLDNFWYEARSQDFSLLMVERIIAEYGLDWFLAYLCSHPEIEHLLFCCVSAVPTTYVFELIKENRVDALLHALSLLVKNDSRKRLVESLALKDYMSNEQTRYRRAIKKAFDMNAFVKRYPILIHENKALASYLRWAMTAEDKWSAFNAQHRCEEIVPNAFVPKIEVPVFSDTGQKAGIGEFVFSRGDLNNTHLSVGSYEEQITKSVSNIAAAIRSNMVEGAYTTLFTKRNTKRGLGSEFIAQHSGDCMALPGITHHDNSRNFLCSIPNPTASKWECLAIYYANSQSPWERPTDEFSLFEVPLGELCRRFIPASDVLKDYLQECHYMHTQEVSKEVDAAESFITTYYEAKIVAWLFGNIEELLLPALIMLSRRRRALIQSLSDSVTLDEIRAYFESAYGALIDTGEISIRWVSEVHMFEVLKHSFPDAVFQARPAWLAPQSFDVYIPSKKLAFEYQGKQHYEPVAFFGGETALARRIVLDNKKRDLANENQVILVEWKYDEPINEMTLAVKLHNIGFSFQ